jgi:hypothetical protein
MYVILDKNNYFIAQIFDQAIIDNQINVVEAPDKLDINTDYKLVGSVWEYLPTGQYLPVQADTTEQNQNISTGTGK